MKKRAPSHTPNDRLIIEALEPRILLSADLLGSAVDLGADDSEPWDGDVTGHRRRIDDVAAFAVGLDAVDEGLHTVDHPVEIHHARFSGPE